MTKDEMIAEMQRRREAGTVPGMLTSDYHVMCMDIVFDMVAEVLTSQPLPVYAMTEKPVASGADGASGAAPTRIFGVKTHDNIEPGTEIPYTVFRGT